jgi:signal transduction histidine kinase/ActR/RegA family two-component response regulator
MLRGLNDRSIPWAESLRPAKVKGNLPPGSSDTMVLLSSLRFRLVGTVFLAVTLGWLIAIVADIEIAGFAAGCLALFAAWYGGERFIVRQVGTMLKTTTRLAAGDMSARTGVGKEDGELGELARAIDSMAGTLEQRVRERATAERALAARVQQQAVVAALGQLALTTNDFKALIEHAAAMVADTLEVQLCEILQLSEDSTEFVLRAGVGWKEGMIDKATVKADPESIPGYAIHSQEAVRVSDYRTELTLTPPTLARYHGAVSGLTVAITGRDRRHPFGVLGAHSLKKRTFTDDDEQFLRAVANLLAMTLDRKRAEAEMRKRAVFAQQNPTPAMEVNAAGEITYSNDAALKLASNMGRHDPRELLPADIVSLVNRVLQSGHYRVEFETHSAGRTLSWSVHPIHGDQLVHCYITDVTEQLKMEGSLRQADKMLAIGQLAAGVAHDFNNMLTVIQGHAGILLQKTTQEAGSRDSAQAIYFAAERASGLTRQLLMFSRKNVKQSARLDLTEVVKGMTDMLERLLGETIELHFTLPRALPFIRGDKNEVEQVVMNLVVNARDAMPGGGKVRITLNPVEISEEDAVLHPQGHAGSFVQLNVADTGCGMDEATMNRIFEPFFTTKEVGKGTGLGLATVYGIAKQHEGWIEVASELGKGSTFTVYLPADYTAREADAARGAPDTGMATLGGNETILVVEDEEALREMANQILASFGYRVMAAESGVKAKEMWQKSADKIDLVLTDMVMPGGISGRDLANHLTHAKPALPVVIASGYSMDDISSELGAGSNISYVQKPYSLDSLARAVRTALDGTKRPSKN